MILQNRVDPTQRGEERREKPRGEGPAEHEAKNRVPRNCRTRDRREKPRGEGPAERQLTECRKTQNRPKHNKISVRKQFL